LAVTCSFENPKFLASSVPSLTTSPPLLPLSKRFTAPAFWAKFLADDAADEQSECYQNAHIEVMYKGEVI
jgi:hypothetical protein